MAGYLGLVSEGIDCLEEKNCIGSITMWTIIISKQINIDFAVVVFCSFYYLIFKLHSFACAQLLCLYVSVRLCAGDNLFHVNTMVL